ncbi:MULTISPECIES: ferredoxin--NADP reductase [Pseudoalteromonas]|uniref:Reductase protein n=1 Tax=Pseudoalteromonas translucida (strain TAC 125) TaxID=326442 RepID=Q3IE71_PSET1|nr:MULTISPECIES: ferredoxin--NADP reductase [Pseudoalteromonas]MBB1405916.1 ferredoxin--NADP reductase [Pseudoalteromonas sp. SG44-5]MBH0092017.1 ferredoxin--NADP reductase [Pseudoalteromonas sp. SCQQ13]CAI85959.1 putative reductase protein [Pseudoalteromonas translucida]|tara:strand:- start:185 stop:1255 length:1071 start_codon:yes stop_codon:yes gene_type:complete
MSRYHNLTIAEVIQETADANSIVFDVPASLTEQFDYQPGQFLTLKLPYEGAFLMRCYSMSSTPSQDTGLRVTVKRVADGRGSNWICDNLKAGSNIEVMQPAGLFVPKDLAEDHLLCAGGSGVTPVLSILRHVLINGTGKVRVIYANRDEASVIFQQTFKALSAQYPERLEVIHLLDSLQGIPSLSLLTSLADGMQQGRAFICGPGPFMDAMELAVKAAKFPASRIHIERFSSAAPKITTKPVPANSLKTPIQDNIAELVVDEANMPAATIQLELDGEHYVIACESGQTVLDAAEKIGIELPYSCREGMCASCMCEVVSGQVKLNNNDVLDEKDLANNLTLSCQAVPLTSELKLKYT